MKRQTFILCEPRTFRHFVTIFLYGKDGKFDKRNITFTTEHLIQEKERVNNARKKHAEFSTVNEILIDAIYRDTGYGITFVHKEDPEGKRKKDAFNVKPLDVKRTALRNIFNELELKFNEEKSVEVLEEELSIYISAKKGVETKTSPPSKVNHIQVDIQQQLSNAVDVAKIAYEEKYKESFPVFSGKNELYNFVDSLSDPNFDPKAYFDTSEDDPINTEPMNGDENELPNTPEELWPIYFSEFKKNVAAPKKNDVGWMRTKIYENRKNK